MSDHFLESYRYHRQRSHRAFSAIALAHKDLERGTRRYTGSWFKSGPYNPPCSHYGGRHCRWVESTLDAGLRRVGTAYELSRRHGSRYIDHTGWYLDDSCFESAVPAVFQLPARKGRPFFVYGYDDPYNPGAAFLCFDNDAETDMDAARYADRMTERMAEEQREYDRAWQAGALYAELGNDIAADRAAIRALMAELRTVLLPEGGEICAVLRATIRRNRSDISRAHKKRARLLADYGHEDAFLEHLPA